MSFDPEFYNKSKDFQTVSGHELIDSISRDNPDRLERYIIYFIYIVFFYFIFRDNIDLLKLSVLIEYLFAKSETFKLL